MSKNTIARYSTGYGLAGCYLDDSQNGPMTFTRRKDFADAIRSELAMYEMPAYLFREVNIKRLWQHIKRNGSSVAHFHLDHKGFRLSFYGLTELEAMEMEERGDY